MYVAVCLSVYTCAEFVSCYIITDTSVVVDRYARNVVVCNNCPNWPIVMVCHCWSDLSSRAVYFQENIFPP